MSKIISIILIAAFLAACQTTTKVNINTNVPGAQVTLNGQSLGTTPITKVKVKNGTGKSYGVVIEKEGYETLQRNLKVETKTANATAVIVGYVLSFAVLPLLLCINGLWIDGPAPDQYFVLEKAE
jgi:predicted S18 family serine protease